PIAEVEPQAALSNAEEIPFQKETEETGPTNVSPELIPENPSVNTISKEIPEQDLPGSTSSLFFTNQHLLVSDLMRSMIIAFHFLYEQFKLRLSPEEPAPWEYIFPKGKDGLPIYNASGKYIV